MPTLMLIETLKGIGAKARDEQTKSPKASKRTCNIVIFLVIANKLKRNAIGSFPCFFFRLDQLIFLLR